VAALFQRVQEEQGQLDLLVNAVWGGNELPGLLAAWAQPSWEQEPAAYWHSMFEAGVRAALIGKQSCDFVQPLAPLACGQTCLRAVRITLPIRLKPELWLSHAAANPDGLGTP
jgi:NAD(P)-dependent dehydrogenase (short-subunit alcohol dehydrogenase family)